MEERHDPMEWKYDQMEEKYGPMEWKYDQMEDRYDPIECKRRLDCILSRMPLHTVELWRNKSRLWS